MAAQVTNHQKENLRGYFLTIVDNNMAAQVTNHSLELSARGNKKEDIRVVIKITSSKAEREISFYLLSFLYKKTLQMCGPIRSKCLLQG